jgi:dihydroorotate dehydrogenase (NAD+) catalytic subunit
VSFTGPPELAVHVGALRLSNPIIAASGTFGYGVEFAHLTDLNLLGGFVVKGLSAQPMEGAAAPRLCPTPAGMLNAVGLQNVGVRAFVAEKLPALRGLKTAVIANVFGGSVEEYAEVIRVLEDADGLAAYELNISCPNVKKGGMQYGGDPVMTAEVVSAARKAAANRPLWVKLSPLVTDITAIARAAVDAGADALTVANTYPAMSIDPVTRQSRIGSTTGGLSGPAIRAITLRLVNVVCQAVHIPVIGLGGIETPSDVAEYILAGSTAVQVGTASFTNPRACEGLVSGVAEWCFRNKIRDINTLRGALV